ncbi:uncharacterized protein EI90DRAFT_3065795 [Cantharellus anzutake]|uniref:uncharacterized protein n=1 Tax=Cantharellus anzutake TaxID=1750568 RepID=UPI001905FBD2|nr:uncharacterized protein EI90DRAFT_3065795 [Cantharellus anzutake]KAF8328171.1 hypothetical protein EI90DRAFT_3065795 [Cantharellus anzutake]
MEHSGPKSPMPIVHVDSGLRKPAPHPFPTSDGGSVLTLSSKGSSTIKASRANIFHGIRFPRPKPPEEREKKRPKTPLDSNPPGSSAFGIPGRHILDTLHKGKGKSKEPHHNSESRIPTSLTPAEEYRRLYQHNFPDRQPLPRAYGSSPAIDLATASSLALQALMSPNSMPPTAKTFPSHSSLQDTPVNSTDFLNELEAAAEDVIPSWLVGSSHMKKTAALLAVSSHTNHVSSAPPPKLHSESHQRRNFPSTSNYWSEDEEEDISPDDKEEEGPYRRPPVRRKDRRSKNRKPNPEYNFATRPYALSSRLPSAPGGSMAGADSVMLALRI